VRPNEAVIAVTMGCNSRCRTCDMWKYDRGREMKPEDYAVLPPSLTHINLSGGEPYLRDDLPEIYAALKERFPDARIVISTNGLVPKRIREMTARMPGAAVRVSIDALGRLNDEIRGVPGSYEKAKETLRLLKEIGVTDLGISATASRGVEGELDKVMDLAWREGMEFVCGVAHSSPIYFGEQNGLRPSREKCVPTLEMVMRRQLSAWRPKEWFRAYMTSGMVDYVESRPRKFRCTAIKDFFYLDAAGIVYPCNMRDDPMGSLLEKDYTELVTANPEIVKKVKTCSIDCWMSCTVAPTLRRRPWIALPWVLSHKAGSLVAAGRNGRAPADLSFHGDGKRSASSGG
jgi:MoaA/NifB/PqqE/SkfB family radical SAM enzyme